jgi:lipopolysaccharide transport system permease protein
MTENREYVIDAAKRRLFDWKELFYYKELFYFFTWRDIKVKYKQTVLGFLWAILQPLLMMIITSYTIGSLIKIPNQTLEYPVFVFSGLLIWTIFSSGLTSSANSMVSNSTIIKKIYFPRLIIPVTSIMVSLFDFMMAFVLFVPLLIYYHQSVSWMAIWCWPLSIVITVIATLGPGSLLAAMNVKYRDFRYVIPFLIQILFFLTPVIYPVSMIKHPFIQYLIGLSPLYAAVELFRMPLTGEVIDTSLMMTSAGSGIVLLFVGLIYFKRTENFFADFA